MDLDLGPVADVNTNPDNPVIGTRSFGTDPRRVADHVVAWLQGLQETGVAACVKHFPGHGDTSTDSHLALPIVDVDLDVLARRELVPFAAAVEAGVAAVMTSHLLVPARRSRPAGHAQPSCPGAAPRTTGVHRRDRHRRPRHGRRLRRAGHPRGRRALAASRAPTCSAWAPTRTSPWCARSRAPSSRRSRSGRLPEARLVDAAARVDRLHRRPSSSPAPTTDQLAGARRAVTVEGALPDLRGAAVVSIATRANIAVGDAAWGLPADELPRPGASPTDGRPATGPWWSRSATPTAAPRWAPCVRDLAATRPVVVVEWGWPGPYDDRAPRICTRGSSLPAVAAVRELLASAGWDR